MLTRIALGTSAGLVALGVAAHQFGLFRENMFPVSVATSTPEAITPSGAASIGEPLYPPVAPEPPAVPQRLPGAMEPIVIPECRLAVMEKQAVPSKRDGTIRFIGTEIEPGEQLAPEQVITVMLGKQEKKFRRLREGDTVRAGQLLAQLDDGLSREDWSIKAARLAASKADLEAALKMSEEAKNRYETQVWLRSEGRSAASAEEVRASKLTWDRTVYEAISRQEAVKLAESELSQAEAIWRMHQVRSTLAGVIQTIHKHAGEAVKSYEPVVELHNLSRLRVEGMVDVQCLPYLSKGKKVQVEIPRLQSPQGTLVGHLQEITAVAFSKDTIVSSSTDGTISIWQPGTKDPRRVLQHPAAVLALACAPSRSAHSLCLAGLANGSVFLWDLDKGVSEPLWRLDGPHPGGVTAVAFSPDDRFCAFGGADHQVSLWDIRTGTLRYRFPAGHGGAVTSLQFTPSCQLITAGRDRTLRLWTVGQEGARLETTFDSRSGDVGQPGTSADGRWTLFDQGKMLRLMSLPEGSTHAVVQSTTGATPFTKFALFSPAGPVILTAAAGENHLRLWHLPAGAARFQEICQLVSPEPLAVTCAAFSPSGTAVVAGTRDRQVVVWPVPVRAELDTWPTAEITLLDQVVESSTRQVRFWAELPNRDGRFLPGTRVSLVINH